MTSNRIKRNIWLTLAIISLACVISRVIDLINGDKEWWHLCANIALTALFTKYYMYYRNQIKKGNLHSR